MDRPKEDDRELILFKELYKSIAPMLIFYAGKYVNAVTAEDLVQDVFLKVWQKRTFLFLKEGIKTYLYRSVQHACLDYLKHQEVKGDYINAVTTKLTICNPCLRKTSAWSLSIKRWISCRISVVKSLQCPIWKNEKLRK